MVERIVTFIVPAYNSEKYLDKCLSSFLCPKIIGRIEIIIVNDGSKDGTARIAEAYVTQYPDSFMLINKENGGHGSGINIAVQRARGRYLRVVDSDDWVQSENLCEYVESLHNASADVVVTNFHKVDAITGRKTPIATSGIMFGRIYSLDEVMKAGKGALSCCMIHGLAYRTDFYLGCGITLSEGIFYEDQEYSAVIFAKANTILYLDLFLYEYLVGTASQSVSDGSRVKRASQLEQVFWKIADTYKNGEKLSPSAKKYLLYKLAETLQDYYVTMFIRNDDRTAGRAEAERLRRDSSEILPDLKAATNFRYRLLYLMHILHIRPRHLEMLKKSPLYLWLRQAIR